MDQLYRFRKGWENENLAQYLLSRVAFIARPVSVSDDVGTDFYCTLFQKANDGSLLPRTAFAIQIKSHNDVASKLDFVQLRSIAERFSEALQQCTWDFNHIGLLWGY